MNRTLRTAAFATLLLSTVVFQAPRCFADDPLGGKIEHSQTLPASDDALKVGIKFEEGQLTGIPANNLWAKIPTWLGGTWSVSQETSVLRADFKQKKADKTPRTFPARTQFTYGQQADRTGQIWHYLGTPYTSATQLSDKNEYHQVLSKDIQVDKDGTVIVNSKVRVIRVSHVNDKITESYQQESITTYAKASDDTINMEASTRVYDSQGNPVSQTDNEATITRVNPFSVIATDKGKDLRSLFSEFLASKGQAGQIPN